MPIPMVVTVNTNSTPAVIITSEMEACALKITNWARKIIDYAQNNWDGPGGPDGFGPTTIGNIIGTARFMFERWMNLNTEQKAKSRQELPPDPKIANASPIPRLAKRLLETVKAHLGLLYGGTNKGAFNLQDVPAMQAVVSLAFENLLLYYEAGEGIQHTDVSHW